MVCERYLVVGMNCAKSGFSLKKTGKRYTIIMYLIIIQGKTSLEENNRMNQLKKSLIGIMVLLICFTCVSIRVKPIIVEAASLNIPLNLNITSYKKSGDNYKVNFEWDKVKGATGYKLYAKAGNGKTKAIYKGSNTKTTSNLKADTKYTIIVRAYKKNGSKVKQSGKNILKFVTTPYVGSVDTDKTSFNSMNNQINIKCDSSFAEAYCKGGHWTGLALSVNGTVYRFNESQFGKTLPNAGIVTDKHITVRAEEDDSVSIALMEGGFKSGKNSIILYTNKSLPLIFTAKSEKIEADTSMPVGGTNVSRMDGVKYLCLFFWPDVYNKGLSNTIKVTIDDGKYDTKFKSGTYEGINGDGNYTKMLILDGIPDGEHVFVIEVDGYSKQTIKIDTSKEQYD